MAPITFSDIRSVRREMREVGVIGPDTARPASDLPPSIKAELDRFVDAGIVREGPPGAYYLDEKRASAVFRVQVLKAVVFWFLVVITPVAILQLSNTRSASP